MDIGRSLKIRDQAVSNVRSLIRWAKSSYWTSQKLTDEYIKVKNELPNGTPRWVTSYVDGVKDTLRNILEHEEIEFCYRLGGKLYSVNRNSDRYYEKHGYKPSELSDKPNGLYWKGTDKVWFEDKN